jgi:hypothetical protein
MEVQIADNHLVMPHGLTPVFLQSLDGRMIAHVTRWTTAAEYDQRRYDLYPLGNAWRFTVPLNVDGEGQTNQDWYSNFGMPTMEGMKGRRGELLVRRRVVDGLAGG